MKRKIPRNDKGELGPNMSEIIYPEKEHNLQRFSLYLKSWDVPGTEWPNEFLDN